MAKQKSKHTYSGSGNKRKNKVAPDVDLPEESIESEWTVVKKQRVTILIPPLASKLQNTIPEAGEGEPQEKPSTGNSQSPREINLKPSMANSQSPREINLQPQYLLPISASIHSVHETEKSLPLSPHQAIPPSKTLHPSPNLILQNPSSLSQNIASDNSQGHSCRDGKGKCISPSGTSTVSRRIMFYTHNSAFLNQRIRASYLEKKLKGAGGLENWLESLRLGCFIKVFQRKRITKFHLANLTMGRLKDMGAHAVGPRRKLMHAIDCLCKPHCFQHH